MHRFFSQFNRSAAFALGLGVLAAGCSDSGRLATGPSAISPGLDSSGSSARRLPTPVVSQDTSQCGQVTLTWTNDQTGDGRVAVEWKLEVSDNGFAEPFVYKNDQYGPNSTWTSPLAPGTYQAKVMANGSGGSNGTLPSQGFSNVVSFTVLACLCREVTAADAVTRSQGFYGNKNGLAFLNANVGAGIVVGTGWTMTFDTGADIHAYMTTTPNGTPAQLTGSHTNPTSTEAGIFGKQVTALKVNMIFDAVTRAGNLGSLTFVDATSAFDGMTVAEILADAERVLGGGAPLAGTTVGDAGNNSYNYVVDQLNLAFDGALAPTAWALQYLRNCS